MPDEYIVKGNKTGWSKLEVMNEFEYLGSTVCANGRMEVEVNHRLKKGVRMMDDLEYLWRNKDSSISAKGVVATTVLNNWEKREVHYPLRISCVGVSQEKCFLRRGFSGVLYYDRRSLDVISFYKL